MKPASYLLVCVSSALLAAAFPPLNLFPLAWIAFVPLFFAVRRCGKIEASCLIYLSQFLFFLVLLHWLTVFGWYAWVGAALYESLFSLAWGWIVYGSLTSETNSLWEILFPAVAYAAMEVVRNLGPLGMPWGDVAYTQWKFLPVVEGCSVYGAIGLSFLIMLANFLVFDGLRSGKWRAYVAAALCFMAPSAFGVMRLRQTAPASFRVALVQSDDSQMLKWSRADYLAMLGEINGLVLQAGALHPNLILLPETALAGYLDLDTGLQAMVRGWAFRTKTYIAVGTLKAENGMPANAIALVEPDGDWFQSYEKVKLVPFGEYLPSPFRPLRGRWHALDPIVDFKPGNRFTVFQTPDADFGEMICFESSFGWIARRFVLGGAKFLAVATNDAWFEGTIAQYEHAVMGLFRAVETGRSFVQAGNTGVSCIIDPWGRIAAWQGPETRAVVAGEIPLESSFTVFDRAGGCEPWFWILAALALYIRQEKTARRAK